jgi:hypothetical protein
MSTAARVGARAQMAVPAASASADEVIDAVKPSDADDDQVDRDDVVQQSRHEEDQDAGDKGNKWGDMGNGNGHWDLLGWQSTIMTGSARGFHDASILLVVIIRESG